VSSYAGCWRGDVWVSSDPGAEEVDGEACRPSRLDVMLDVGRNALRKVRLDDHVSHRIRASNEPQRPGFDTQATPRPSRHSMRATERGRHRALIPRGGGPHLHQAVGELATVAERAIQRADTSISLRWVLDPRCGPERRTMRTGAREGRADYLRPVLPVDLRTTCVRHGSKPATAALSRPVEPPDVTRRPNPSDQRRRTI